MREVTDRERRRRLAVRHALHPEHRAGDPLAATEAVTALHATEAASVHLAVRARTEGVTAADVDRALYEDRVLVKQLAMRRTLFTCPRDLLPAVWGSASARVAGEQRRRVAKDVEKHGVAADGGAWLDTARDAVLERLRGAEPVPAARLREEVPEIAGTFTVDEDKKYGGTFNISPRVLGWLGAEALIVRGPNAGHWRTSRPTWTLMSEWLGEEPEPWSAPAGYAEITRRWLHSFGPGTLEDLQWWLGATKGATRTALADVGAVEVGLAGERTGWLLPDDVDEVPEVEPWAALLPVLDPTTMGWKERGFYLDPAHVPLLFDTNGNGGTTAWWDGRIVGAWVQDEDGVVQVVLCPGADVGDEGRRTLDAEAARLTEWLEGVRITNVYASRLMKGRPLP